MAISKEGTYIPTFPFNVISFAHQDWSWIRSITLTEKNRPYYLWYILFIYRCLGDNDTRYTDGFHKFHPSFYTGSKKATRSERGSIQTHYRKTKHYFRVTQFFSSKLRGLEFVIWIQLEMFKEFSNENQKQRVDLYRWKIEVICLFSNNTDPQVLTFLLNNGMQFWFWYHSSRPLKFSYNVI